MHGHICIPIIYLLENKTPLESSHTKIFTSEEGGPIWEPGDLRQGALTYTPFPESPTAYSYVTQAGIGPLGTLVSLSVK